MKVVCTICTDHIKQDFCAAPCGHVFHFQCLSQWLAHRKTCPECRDRCLQRNVIKLFVHSNDLTLSQVDTLDPQELQEKLSTQQNLMTHKDKALAEAKESLGTIQKEMKAWQAQHKETHRKLMSVESRNETLKRELRGCEGLREEVERLRKRVGQLDGVEQVLKGCKEDVDEVVQSHKTSSTTLGMIVVALKKDYEVLKDKRATLVREKSKLAGEVSSLKKEVMKKDKILRDHQDQVSELERDLHSAEREKKVLQTKMEMLQEAVDSPDSRVALKRILESPMPEQLANQPRMREAVDIGASPLLLSRRGNSSVMEGGKQEPKKLVGFKRPRPCLSGDTENMVVMPISKFGSKGAFQPRTAANMVKKDLKFAPRKNFGLKQSLNFKL